MDARDRDDKLNETRFAGELRGQFDTLAGGADALERRPRRRRLLIALAAGLLVAVVLGGIALAGGMDPLRDTFDPLLNTFWPQNEHGQTYGSAGVAKSYEDEPDLIAVASDGKRGYCYKTDLDGPPPPRSPEAESAYHLNLPGMLGYAIPQVRVGRHDPDRRVLGRRRLRGVGLGRRPGRRADRGRQRHAHHDERAFDGAIAVTRRWLDGRETSNSAEDDPSLSRLPRRGAAHDLA